MAPMTKLKLDRDAAIRKIRASRNRSIFLHVSRLFESRTRIRSFWLYQGQCKASRKVAYGRDLYRRNV